MRALAAGAALAAALVATAGAGGRPIGSVPAAPAAATTAAPDATAAPPRLSRAEVPAAGHQEVILTIGRFGRYSVRAESRQGSAVRVVDRMAGELGAAGEAGHENGRLDLFLDRGDYKVAVEGHERGEGTAKLTVAPFESTHEAPASVLVERKLVQDGLEDLRQISWWLRLAARREVRLLAAGRNLADLRLWRDGSWLEDAAPSCTVTQPVTGRPLLRCEISAELPAGLYLVTAYGGPALPWAEDAADHPLYLRWGYPRLADADRRRYQVSPFGEDHFELPGNVNYVRIELPQAAPALLAAGWRQAGQALPQPGDESALSDSVTKKSVPPVAAVKVPARPAASAQAAGPSSEREAGQPAPGAAGGEPSIGGDDEEVGEDHDQAGESAGTRGAPGRAAGEAPSEAAGAPVPIPPPREEEPAAAAAGAEGPTSDQAADGEDDQAKGGEGAAEGAGSAAAGAAAAEAGPRLWVSVRGTPGQVYVLQHFERRESYTFHDKGLYWLSTVHSGDPRDSVDATAVLVSHAGYRNDRDRLDMAAAVPIDGEHAWARRFNLLGRLELFLEVKETGAYEVVSAGDGRFRIEPFLTERPEKYKPPDFAPGGSRWDLDAGLYVLTAEPSGRGGIATLGVRPAGKFAGLLGEAEAAGGERDPVRGSARLAPVALDSDRWYTVHVNRQPGVEAGLALRRWPVDLDRPLPVTQRPGEPLAIDFTVAAPGTLRAETEDGQALEAAVDGGPWQTATAVPAGGHHVQVRNPAGTATAHTVSYSLWVEPLELGAAAPLPPLPEGALAALPRFPVLRPGPPRFIDLARGASATFLVQADQPALYLLQTTGVLATAAALRTRTVVSLAAGSANGVGRNALVRQYLRQGDFQATVTATGRSQGHLGIELQSAPLVDGGELRLGAPARITLHAGQGVVYRFTIGRKDDYRLLAMGLGFVYTCRLEDADGWPVAPPNLAADITHNLAPGSYRLVLLPRATGGRAVTLLTRRREKLYFEGHGPHPLPLGIAVEHLWREPDQPPGGTAEAPAGGAAERQTAPGRQAAAEGQAERPPDLWRFELPATATATLSLDAEMTGTLTRLGGPGETAELGRVPPGRRLTLQLAAGRYQLAAVCSRRNNLVRYRVRVATRELVDGEEALATAPVTLPVSVGGAGLVEISSFSASDVRARLYAAGGRLVADEDDRPDDWNFLVSERLPAGRYRLEIEPVGRRHARLRVAMRTAAEVEEPRLALPYHGELALGNAVHLLPLGLPRQSDLLLVAARSQENVGLALEVRDGSGWRLIGSRTGREPRLELPMGAAGAGGGVYRLRLWSPERRDVPVHLAAAAVTLPRVREGQLAKGAALPAVTGLAPPLGPLAAAVVELSRPGLLRLQLGAGGGGDRRGAGEPAAPVEGGPAAGPSWRGGAVAGQLLAPLPEAGPVTVAGLRESGQRVWLVAMAPPHGAPRVRGDRLALAAGLDRTATFQLPAPGATVSCDLDRGGRPAGPVLAMVTAPDGQPAVQVGEAAGEGAVPRGAATLAIGPRSAVSVALAPRQPAARVWNGEPADPRAPGAPMEVRLAQLGYAPPRPEAASWGVIGGSISGFAARQFVLPAGAKKLRLSLGAALVAVLSEGDSAASTHWQGGLPFEELLDGGATRLTLLHTREGSDPFTFELLPRAAAEGELALLPGAPFVRRFDRAGTLRLRLPGAAAGTDAGTGAGARADTAGERDGSTNHYRVWMQELGVAREPETGVLRAALLDGAGGVRRGADLAGAPGGFLLIQHGPGVVAAWTAGLLEAGAETVTGAAWRAPLAAPAQEVTPPATVALGGHHAHLTITSREPAVLHVRAATPALTLLARPAGAAPAGSAGTAVRPAGAGAEPAGGAPGSAETAAGTGGGAAAPAPAAAIETVAIHPTGVRLDAFVPAGRTQLGFAALGDGELAGFAELTTTPVLPTGEGRGPEVLLPAGATRYFSFHVASRRPVGWGAAAGAESVTCTLLSADGRAVPAGAAPPAAADLVRMAELDAGDYLLALTSPPDAPPLRARPVVVGLELPDTGPPPEVIRQYLQDSGAAERGAGSGSQP
jgi:hypothetical protein